MSIASKSALEYLDLIAALGGGLFAGTAFWMTVGEVPAMRALGLDEHWRFFPHMYETAYSIQSICAGVAGVGGILHGIRIIGSSSDRNVWITAGTIFLGLFPYTIFCMVPTNNRIVNDNKQVKLGQESQINVATRKELLDQWNALHLVRTITSIIGFSTMLYGVSRHSSLLFKW